MDMWLEIVGKWDNVIVPDVEIIHFDPDVHENNTCPWFDNIEKRQINFDSKPIIDTAKGLVYLNSKDNELAIAFKLLGFTRGKLTPCVDTLNYALYGIFEKYGEAVRHWWPPAAKHVLPINFNSRDYGILPPYKQEELTEVIELVEQAALTWKAIAQTVSIVTIPGISFSLR